MIRAEAIEKLALSSVLAGQGTRSLVLISGRVLHDAVRSRWFLLYTLAFMVLGLGVAYVSAAGAGGVGLSGFGRTTAGLVNLVLLVVPLMALTAGAGAVSSERERGMLAYMVAQPISRFEYLLGTYLGLLGALFACITIGFGAAALILAWKSAGSGAQSMIWLCALAFILAAGMLSVGLLISTLARRSSVAVGTAVFTWLVLAFATDLALMGGQVALDLSIEDLFLVSLVNPLQVFKMWSLHAAEANLDILGPAGLFAVEEYGGRLHIIFGGALSVWVVAPLIVAQVIFSRRSPL